MWAFHRPQAVMISRVQHSLWFSLIPGSRCGSNLLPVAGLEAHTCPATPLPHKSVPAAETGIGSTPAMVPSLPTSQPPPERRFPKLWLGRGVEQDRGRGNLQTRVDTHKFPISLSLSYQGTVTCLVCDAASFLQHFVPLSTSILLSSLSNQLCIIHICWEIWTQLKETNDFC